MKTKKVVMLVLFMFASLAIFAQEAAVATDAAAAATTPQPEQGFFAKFWELYQAGGTVNYIITIIGLIVLVMTFIKAGQLWGKEKIDAQKFYLKLKGYIKNEQYDEAIKVAKNFQGTTLGYTFWNGLLAFNDARKAGVKGRQLQVVLQNAFDEAGLQLIPRIESMIFWFDVLAQTATLLGLLGTIQGLIGSFRALATAAESEKQKLLTTGIYQAMGTTFAGLSVAIPTQVFRGFLQSRAEKIISEIDEFSVKTINQINYTIKD
jgi:biopolymer transport protein ExbB/TolQ